jgi:hypothetical protein
MMILDSGKIANLIVSQEMFYTIIIFWVEGENCWV